MITVERRRSFQVPAERVLAVLGNVDQLDVLIPRAERVAVLSQHDGRARVAITLRLGNLGTHRIEGEARRLDDGVRFVAVQPIEIDAVYKVLPRGDHSEVVARLATEMPKALGPLVRFVPQRMIQERVAHELEAALDALDAAVGAHA